jgi:hypothetical protein
VHEHNAFKRKARNNPLRVLAVQVRFRDQLPLARELALGVC